MRKLLLVLAACGGGSGAPVDGATSDTTAIDVAPLEDATPADALPDAAIDAPTPGTLAPASHDFGDAPLGGASAAFAFTVTNPGTTAIMLGTPAFGGSDPTQFALVANACPSSLAAGASCALTVQLQPTQSGTVTATLELGGATATLRGQGAGTWVAITPTLYDFGSIAMGLSSVPVKLTVTNTRGLPLPQPTITVGGADASSFGIAATTCSSALAVDATCTIDVYAKPYEQGMLAATLTVVAGGVASATLLADGVGEAYFSTTPSFASFDPSHTVRTFTATNESGVEQHPGNVSLAGSGAAAFQVVASDCIAAIAANATCTFTIAYLPSAGDAWASAQLTFVLGETVYLAGSATDATDLTTALFVDFGDTALDTDSTRTLTFANTGATMTPPLALALGGADGARWRLANDQCSGAALDPSATCTVDLVFRPLASASSHAILTATAGALNAHANLTGTGHAVGSHLSIAPASHDFGAQGIGGQTAPFAFTVSNDSGVTVPAPFVTLAGASATQFAIATNGCTSGLAPGDTCTVGVRFAPTSSGADQVLLRAGSAVASLFGQGAFVTSITTSNASVDLGTVAVGATAQTTFEIRNFSTDATGPLAHTLQGANKGDFTVTGCDTALAGNSACTVTVTVTPSASGTRTATVVYAASPGGTVSIALTAQGS